MDVILIHILTNSCTFLIIKNIGIYILGISLFPVTKKIKEYFLFLKSTIHCANYTQFYIDEAGAGIVT